MPNKVNKFLEKYEAVKGKQLFIRLPKKLPKKIKETENYIKTLNERIIKVHRPRQKSCRHCLIEFDNENDRVKALKELSKVEVDGKKLIVSIPKTESEEFIEKVAQYRSKKFEKMLEKKKGKKIS